MRASVESLSASRVGAWRRAWRALRGSGWWYFCLLPLTSLIGDPRADGDVALRLVGSVAVAGLCLAFAYGFNGIVDRGMDRDAGKNSLAGLVEVPREAVALVVGCALVALGIAAMLTPVALLGTGMSLVAGTLYSGGLKRLPVVGTLVNVLIFVPLPFLAMVDPPTAGMLFLIVCFYVLVTQNQILHEIGDSEEDLAAGVRTTGVAIGATGVRLLAVLLGPMAVLVLWRAWASASPALTIAAALGLCGGAAMVAFCDEPSAARLRVAHRWYSLAVGAVLFGLVAWVGA
jgi:4-hydroxybenzoate polyprenyltransferase